MLASIQEIMTADVLFLIVAFIAILLLFAGHFLATRVVHPSYQYLREIPFEYIALFSFCCGVSTLLLQHFTELGKHRLLCAISGLGIGFIIYYALLQIFNKDKK